MQPDLIFVAQSASLRVWAGTISPVERLQPSGLPGWSVADLLAHLAQVHDSVAALRPAGGGAEPMSVSDYLAGYRDNADQIAASARKISGDTSGDPLSAWDDAAAQARQTLGALGAADRLVQTGRGAILASDFLDTRIIELVVHATDLQRALADHRAPSVLPSAMERAVHVLREVLTDRATDPVGALAAASRLEPDRFVLLAAGRIAAGDRAPDALMGEFPLL